MTPNERAARDRIAELYRTTNPSAAQARLAEISRYGRGAIGPHGPIGFYVCGMVGHPATAAEMYARHLETCLYCLATPYHFTERLTPAN